MAVDRQPEFFAGKDIRIGIIGCGYVGLPLALRFADVGQRVTGFDTDEKKITALNAGQSYIQHISADKIKQHVQAKRFDATTDFTRLREMDAVLICVPTPLDERREPDLSYVEKTAQSIAPNLQRNQLIVLESTTYPGTTEELVLPILEKGGLQCPLARGAGSEKVATDFYLAFSPEREDPGNKQYGLAQIPKVVGGINPASGRAAVALVRADCVEGGAGKFDACSGNGEAAGKHFSLREYRPGERTQAAFAAHGPGYMGSD